MTRTRRGVAVVMVGFAGASLVGAGIGGQADGEAAALPRAGAGGLDGAVLQLDQPPDQREPDAQPALRPVEAALALDEQIEDVREQVRRDAHARVLHLEECVGPSAPDGHANAAAGLRVLERVGEQVGDDLLEPHAVGVDPHRHRLDAQRDAPGSCPPR